MVMKLFMSALSIVLAVWAVPAQAATDEDIKKAIIQQSIASYPGNCPCPYNTDRAGRSCGRRSAYSRGGGNSPLCYDQDVTPAMVQQYKARKR
jgi:hypothetical protein